MDLAVDICRSWTDDYKTSVFPVAQESITTSVFSVAQGSMKFLDRRQTTRHHLFSPYPNSTAGGF